MILHITKFCSFAVRAPEVEDKPQAIHLVEVVPESDEGSWKILRSFSADNIEVAIEFADGMEEIGADIEIAHALRELEDEYAREQEDGE